MLAWAQQPCDWLGAELQACNLPDPQTMDLDWQATEQGDAPFNAVSRTCTEWFWIFCLQWQGVNHTLTVDGDSIGNDFLLSGPNGSIRIGLTYSSEALADEPLMPGLPTALIPGSIDFNTQHTFTVHLAEPGPPLLAGIYTGNFQVTLSQQGNCGSEGCQTSAPVPFSIELVVPANIKIGGLSDMTIEAPAAMSNDEDFCVFTQGGANFGIEADSLGGNGSFKLAGSIPGEEITYNVEVDTLPASAPLPLSEGVSTLPGTTWSGHLQEDCGGGSNMRIVISLPVDALDNAMETSYTDILTLTVQLE